MAKKASKKKIKKKTPGTEALAIASPAASGAAAYHKFVQDTAAGLPQPAQNQAERHSTLVSAVKKWKDDDVGLIERVDDGADHGWGMDLL